MSSSGGADATIHMQNAKALWEAAEDVRNFWGIEDEAGYGHAMHELATILDVLRDDYSSNRGPA